MAAKLKLPIDVGSSFRRTIVLTADSVRVDLTGYTAAMKIRNVSAAGRVLITLSSALGSIGIEETEVDGDATGVVTFEILASVTSALPTSVTDGVYDLELYPAGDVGNGWRILEGAVVFRPQVTR